MLNKLFPKYLNSNVLELKKHLFCELKCDVQQNSVWALSNGDSVNVPYRLNVSDDIVDDMDTLSETQRNMLCCILSRSYDGFIRQKYIDMLLNSELSEWMLPFIIKLCDEYIESTINLVYEKLRCADNELLACFCDNNKENLNRGYARMASYWNEYYRDKCPELSQYVGYKLYHDIFGIN